MVHGLKKINKEAFDILVILSKLAHKKGARLYLIGGSVRDIILGTNSNIDLDIVVEDDAISFAEHVASHFKCEIKKHETFRTATVFVPNHKVDFATARNEEYKKPGALPTVSVSHLKDDMARRDFTINTMAVDLNEKTFGELIDICGGQKDLKSKVLRALHDASFTDDATRILRGIRFENRFGFKFESHTLKLAKDAIKKRALLNIHPHRLYDEMKLILDEPDPVKCLKRVDDICGFDFLSNEIKFDKDDVLLLRRIAKVLKTYRAKILDKRKITEWLVYFSVLTYKLPKRTLSSMLKLYGFKKGEELILLSINKHLKAMAKLKKLSTPSKIFKILDLFSYEAILFFLAYYYEDKNIAGNIQLFLEELSGIKVMVRGSDLIRLNIVPVRIYGKLLEALLYAKIDKRLKDKSAEISEIMKIYKKLGIQ